MNRELFPLVSIMVPTYNSHITIKETLNSILRQSYKNIKIIVVDNASTDGTVEIIKKLSENDSRLTFVVNEENIGGERNYTKCIALSLGKYCAIYHADDIYELDIIEKEVNFLEENKDAGAVFTAAVNIDKNAKIIGKRDIPKLLLKLKKQTYSFEDIFKVILKCGNFMIFPSAMVRTDIYKNEIKAWNERDYKTSADLDVWLRISERHNIGFLNKPLIRYRCSSSSTSYNIARTRHLRQDLFLVLERYVKKYSRGFLTEKELLDYDLLILKDDINLAINQIIKGKGKEARSKLKNIFVLKNILRSFDVFVQFRMLLIGYAAWISSFFLFNKFGSKLMYKIRHG